jgi:hypothetical protein
LSEVNSPLVANPVAVGVVAAAAVIISPCRRRADRSRADGRRTIAPTIPVAAIAIATASNCDRATSSASNRDSATAVASARDRAAAVATTVKSATAPIAATAATAGIGIVWDQAGGEQNECCKSSKNIAKHG